MLRRARIKVAANLSTQRRSGNKNSSETQNATKDNIQKSKENDANSQPEHEKSEASSQSTVISSQSSIESFQQDDISSVDKNEEKLNEKSLELNPAENEATEKRLSYSVELPIAQLDKSSTFKTPLQMPRAEIDSSVPSASQSSGNKFRRFKIAPRLNTSRNVPKVQVIYQYNMSLRGITENILNFRKQMMQ